MSNYRHSIASYARPEYDGASNYVVGLYEAQTVAGRADDEIERLERELAAAKARIETELQRGQQWCADFIAMRKERDQARAEVERLKSENDHLRLENGLVKFYDVQDELAALRAERQEFIARIGANETAELLVKAVGAQAAATQRAIEQRDAAKALLLMCEREMRFSRDQSDTGKNIIEQVQAYLTGVAANDESESDPVLTTPLTTLEKFNRALDAAGEQPGGSWPS